MPEVSARGSRVKVLLKRSLSFCTYWFEVPLIVAVFLVGAYRGIDTVTNLDHVGFALATAAIVRCFESARHMFERVGKCEEFREIAFKCNNEQAEATYEDALEELKIWRGVFLLSSVISAVVWLAVALQFVFALEVPVRTAPATAAATMPDNHQPSETSVSPADPANHLHEKHSIFRMGALVMFLMTVAATKTWKISQEDKRFSKRELASLYKAHRQTKPSTAKTITEET